MNRQEFLKLSSHSALALFLSSCNIFTQDDKPQKIKEPVKPGGIAQLSVKETGNVVYITKENKDYEKLKQRFNKRITKNPKVIALCKNTHGVAEAVKYANSNQLQISVKSGGHSFEGFSTNEGGLVIDLSLVNSIEWLENKTAKIGPGCKLSQLYDAILPEGRIIPAGSCGSVGLGGLTLGGGYGIFSRKYGLTCDSLLHVTVIDGKGNIHSSENNEELLWACKGAGNGNFGIVTEMTFNTYPAPGTFQSHRFKAYHLDATRALNILQKWFEVSGKLPLSCFGAFVLNQKTLTILITNYEEHSSYLQELLDELSPYCDKTTKGAPVPLNKALKVFYGVQSPIYFKNASAGLYTGFEQVAPFIEQILSSVINSQGLIYQVNTLGGKINDPEKERLSAYAHRALPFLSELQAYWQKPDEESRLVAKFEEIQSIFKLNGITSQYVNYPDLGFENWQEAYYGQNYQRLQKVKNDYDPENFIRHEQSITS